MELPKWWIKFEETCSLVITVTILFTILLGGLFYIARLLWMSLSSFSETTSLASFDPFLSGMLWFFAGWGFSDIFPHFADWVDHILDALIKTFLRLFLLMPLLILGLFVQLFFEATIGPWKKPFIPVSSLLVMEQID